MKSSLLVYRYAKAFLDLAIQRELVDESLNDLLLVKTTIEGDNELLTLIHQPLVSKERKISILSKIFENKVESITIDFLRLIIEKNRDAIITEVYDKYYELYHDYKKIALVTIITAVNLDETTTDRIVNILKHKIVKMDSIKVTNVIDKNIIGGFIVKYKDYVYDASVTNTMKRLHSIFEENLYIKEY
ncbi:MAG: ATP synthase F1 subunit delta [Bacteroidales bacterium]|nr:ATP synthase F1 subunit delta [Bacteroidales bacterium]